MKIDKLNFTSLRLICFGILALLFCNPAKIKAQDCCLYYCPNRFWFDAECLYWQLKKMPQPVPLVTTGPVTPNLAPVLGEPDTIVVLGGKAIRLPARAGGRFTIGCRVDPIFSTEFRYLFIGNSTKEKAVSSDGLSGSPFLALPFFNILTGSESSTRIALPGSFAGKAKLKVSDFMQDIEWNGLFRLGCFSKARVQGLAGFRFWNLNERLTFSTNSPSIIPPIDIFLTKDKFRTHNYFYGAQVGVEGEYFWKCFTLKARGKLALGAMREIVDIQGILTTNDFNGFGVPKIFPAGYFALPTNRGHRSRTRFAVLPEVNINLSYQIASCLSVQCGYTFLYVSNVLRVGDQIDRHINPTQTPTITGKPSTEVVGSRFPKPRFKASSFWAQGLNAGLVANF